MTIRLRRPIMLAASVAVALSAVASWGPHAGRAALAPKLTGTWAKLAVGGFPGTPVALADDPVRGQLIAESTDTVGGYSTAVLHGATWQSSAAPPGEPPSTLAYDPGLGAVVDESDLCASTWNGAAWSFPMSCAPFSPGSFTTTRAVAYDGLQGTLLVVADRFAFNCCLTVFEGTETWSWNGQVWQQLNPRHEPTPLSPPQPALGCPDISCLTAVSNPVFSETGSATWDPTHHRVVLIGDGNRTWTWNGTDWSGGQVPAPGLPPLLMPELSVSYDPVVATDIAFGPPTAAWSGTLWQPVATTGLPPPAGLTAYDAQLGGLVLLGGAIYSNFDTLWRFTPGTG